MYISLWENYRGHPDNISFMQFSTKIDGFEQKDSQGFENSYNSYEQYPLEKFFIFTIYQNYTLALSKLSTCYEVNDNTLFEHCKIGESFHSSHGESLHEYTTAKYHPDTCSRDYLILCTHLIVYVVRKSFHLLNRTFA